MSAETDRDAMAMVIMNSAALSVVEAEWVADAILESDWLADHDARVAAETRKSALREIADRLADWEFPAGSDALEPMYRLVTTLRAEADR